MELARNVIFYDVQLLLTNPEQMGETTTNWSSTLEMLGQFFYLVAAFVLIIILAVYSLKIAAKFKNQGSSGSNLRLLETKSLSANNYVHIVKVGNAYYMIGSSKENVTFLAALDKDSIDYSYEIPKSESKFESQLKSQLNSVFKKHKQDNTLEEKHEPFEKN